MKMLHGVTKGLPQTGLQGGAGVGVFYLHRMLTSKIAFLQNHPLAAPIGFVVLGHVLKKSKKLGTVGAALCGAGGYAGAQVFEMQKALAANPPINPTQTSGLDDASGMDDDTGALVSTKDIGMLVAPSGVGDLSDGVASSYDEAYRL